MFYPMILRDIMQRTLGTILVVVMVVFAGCGGVLGGGSDEPVETLTPAPVPTDKPTPTPVPQLAPGLTGNGIENMSALVAASKSFFQNRTFTVMMNKTAVAPNGTVLSHTTGTLHAGSAGKGFVVVYESEGDSLLMNKSTDPVRTEAWSDSERFFEKQTYANGTTTYNRLPIDGQLTGFGYAIGPITYLPNSFGINDTTVTERLTRKGTTLYRVSGTVSDVPWANVSFRLLVDSHGIIHEFTIVRHHSSTEGIAKTVSTVEFSKIGMTDAPKRPSWVDEAINRTTPIPEETPTPAMPSIQRFSTTSAQAG
jgi:hypothetical protein